MLHVFLLFHSCYFHSSSGAKCRCCITSVFFTLFLQLRLLLMLILCLSSCLRQYTSVFVCVLYVHVYHLLSFIRSQQSVTRWGQSYLYSFPAPHDLSTHATPSTSLPIPLRRQWAPLTYPQRPSLWPSKASDVLSSTSRTIILLLSLPLKENHHFSRKLNTFRLTDAIYERTS